MSYDYAADDFVESPDDFLIGNVANVSDKDTDAIETDNRFLTVPPGVQELEVIGFFGAPEKVYCKVFVNGQLVGFDSYSVSVKFGLASNHKATISDRFILPPTDAAGLKAYFYGVPEATQNPGTPSKMAPGILGNRFSHFINRLGFAWGPGQPFPADAQRMGNWKGRRIQAKIKAGSGTYKAKDGTEKPRDNQIEWFSYKVAGTPVCPPPKSHARDNGTGRTAQAARSAVNGAAVAAAAGLDDI